MRSCIYEGRVRHERLLEKKHAFSYSMFMMYLDLDELPDVFAPYWLWSAKRPAPARFRREDHVGDAGEPLDESVRQLVSDELGFRPDGPVRLLTGLRHLGFLMNPVSFYYCFDPEENPLAIVAEVTNTPWSEQFCYVLDARTGTSGEKTDGGFQISNRKTFHVSPFMPMNMSYRWIMTAPLGDLSISIDSYLEEKPAFRANLSLKRRKISSASLASVLLRFPLMSLKTAAGIYWQALRLRLKKVSFYPHPRKRQNDVSTAAST